MEFAGDDVGFMFQPRKPMTRNARKVMESRKEAQNVSETAQPLSIIYLSLPTKEELVVKQKKGKKKIIEKSEIETLKEQLEEVGKETSALKQEAKKHRSENVQSKKMRKI